jgi:hypothetical protein
MAGIPEEAGPCREIERSTRLEEYAVRRKEDRQQNRSTGYSGGSPAPSVPKRIERGEQSEQDSRKPIRDKRKRIVPTDAEIAAQG